MHNIKINNYNPDVAIHPGKFLQETLEELFMSQAELAKRISRPEKTISEIIHGFSSITSETAIQLEKALDVPASFWNNLQKNYNEINARLDYYAGLSNEIPLMKKYPYSIMVKYKWVEETKDEIQRVINLLRYFNVASLNSVYDVMNSGNNFRKHTHDNFSETALAAWLRKGDIDAKDIVTSEFNADKLRDNLDLIRTYTRNTELDTFISPLKKLFAELGIVLVLTPDLPSTYVCGASRWINPTKAIIQISNRGKYADIFWFTLFHEIAHILLHDKRRRFIDGDEVDKTNVVENEANEFSLNTLIPKEKIALFYNALSMSSDRIRQFAEQNNIHPGILIGRMAKAGFVDWYSQYSALRVQYKFPNS